MIANIVVNPEIYRYIYIDIYIDIYIYISGIAWNGAELLGINWPLPPKLD